MISDISIDNIRTWFNSVIESKGWSYASLARIETGYKSESGLKKALKTGTIKYDALMVLIKEKGVFEEFNSFINKETVHQKSDEKTNTTNSDANIKLQRIALEFVENEEELMKIKIVSNIIDLRVSKKLLEISKSKESLVKFLED